MTWIAEHPWQIALGGFFFTLATLWGWVQTGSQAAFRTGIGLAIATLLLVLFSINSDSPRKEVVRQMDRIMSLVAANRIDEIERMLSPGASPALRDGIAQSRGVQVEKAQITRLHGIDLSPSSSPTTAKIRMNVVVQADVGGAGRDFPQYVEVEFHREGNDWKIFEVFHGEPTIGFQNDPSSKVQRFQGPGRWTR